MQEQAQAGEGQYYAVLVAAFNDMVIADGAAGFGDVLYAALDGAFYVITKGEESIGAAADAGQLFAPFLPIVNLEIHEVFLRFPMLGLCQNLLLFV